MLVWLLALLLLIGIIYVVYRMTFATSEVKIKKSDEQRYTFKI